MKNITLLILFSISSLCAQEKKYQSLLWEVSGNGLAKKSYLYGSMHVSDKVSYHLSDAFFTHLLNADMVANESEPSTWTDLFGLFNTDYSQYRQFYSRFYQYPLTREQLYPLFQSNNFTLDNLLFRTNEYQKEYQEDTYLDMFIYRTGRKFNKKTVGLEDTKTSIIGIMNADLSNNKPKEQNIAAIQKILKNNGYEEALMNFYRDKDLDMIDSLTSLSTSENYLKALLYDRNIVMVKSIDSLARQGSLFAAVGAAHLPGQKGIIEMLRRKGYTVSPVFDSYTDKGKATKQQIEELFIKPAYKRRVTADGVIELPLYTSVIENNENLESPDLANGGYINVKRLLLRDYLKKDNKPFDHKSLDSLFYENIPGKILSKNFYVQEGYSIYDIKNITKTGNTQHYKYLISPLEIISVSMAGEGDYVRRFEGDVFSNIQLKPISGNWDIIAPKRGGFSVEMPAYTVIYGDRTNAAYVPDIEMHSYDNKDKANYFVIERTLQNNDYLEDSMFELKRIHYEFYKQLEIDSTHTLAGSNPLSFTSSSKLGDKTLRLKSLIKGNKYYLLGSIGAPESNTLKFFNSFSFKPFAGTVDYKTFADSTASFTIEVPKTANERLDFESTKKNIYNDEEKVNHFAENYNDYMFSLPSGQTISLSYYQRHRYEARKPIDTLWRNFRHMVTGYDVEETDSRAKKRIQPYKQEKLSGSYLYDNEYIPVSTWEEKVFPDSKRVKIINEKRSYNKEGDYHQTDLLAIDERSEQAIRYRALYKNGKSYTLSTIVDKNYKNDHPDIERVFNSVKLQETNSEVLPEDKLKLFIEDAGSAHDSIRFSALASVAELKITTENVSELIGFIEKFSFAPSETNGLISLYKKIGHIEDPQVIPFLEKQYKQEKTNTIIQFAVLDALTNQRTKAAYKKIIELLEHDLPLADRDYEINNLFRSFEGDLKHSQVLYPAILQFYSIPEYHQPIINFTAALLSNESISYRKLKSYRKMIITNAKLELKRIRSRKTSKDQHEEEGLYYNNTTETDNLIGYLNLLHPFKKDKNVKAVFEDAKALGSQETDMEILRLDLTSNTIDKAAINKLLDNPETLFLVYNLLIAEQKTEYITQVSDEQIASSALMALGKLKTGRHTVTFISHRTGQLHNLKIGFYFYRVKSLKNDNYRPETDRIGGVAFIYTGNNRPDPLAYNYLKPVYIMDEDKLESYMEAIMDETLNEDKRRASFGKSNGMDEDMFYSGYEGY